jgi:hypothetical protein
LPAGDDQKIPCQELDAFKAEGTTLEEGIAEAEQYPNTGALLYEKLLRHAANRIAKNINQKG